MKNYYKYIIIFFVTIMFCWLINGIVSIIDALEMTNLYLQSLYINDGLRELLHDNAKVGLIFSLICVVLLIILIIEDKFFEKKVYLNNIFKIGCSSFIVAVAVTLIVNGSKVSRVIDFCNIENNEYNTTAAIVEYEDYMIYQVVKSSIVSTFTPLIIISLIIICYSAYSIFIHYKNNLLNDQNE